MCMIWHILNGHLHNDLHTVLCINSDKHLGQGLRGQVASSLISVAAVAGTLIVVGFVIPLILRTLCPVS